MGQTESITYTEENDLLSRESLRKSEKYLKFFSTHYEKCGILIPNKFTNQFGEIVDFSVSDPIHGLKLILETNNYLKFSVSNNLNDLLQYFKTNE